MEICEKMLAHYLLNLMRKANEQEETPQVLSFYDEDVMRVYSAAFYHNEIEPFRLGVEYLLLHPEIELRSWIHVEYFLLEEDLRRALTYMHHKLWPAYEPLSVDQIKDVKISPIYLRTWREWREKLAAEEAQQSTGKPVEVSEERIRHYLGFLVLAVEGVKEYPADFAIYNEAIQKIEMELKLYKEMDTLRLGFCYLFLHPEIDLTTYARGGPIQHTYPLRTALYYLYHKIWLHFPSRAEIATVRLVR